MEYMYAAMLLHKVGQKVTEDSIKHVLEAAGAKPDAARIKALVASLEGVDIEKVIKEAPVATAASGEAKPQEKPKEDEKKKADEEKKSEEAAAAGLGALFG